MGCHPISSAREMASMSTHMMEQDWGLAVERCVFYHWLEQVNRGNAMSIAKLSSKAQVVIPADIRRKLGLRPGDLVELQARGDAVIIRKAARSTGEKPITRKAATSATEALKAFRSPLFKGRAGALRRERAEWDA